MTKRQHSPSDDAWEALGLLDTSIRYDSIIGRVVGNEEVTVALDALASALASWQGLGNHCASLDEVLAEMGEDDALIELAAQLSETMVRAGYGGLEWEETGGAERAREQLATKLEALIQRLDQSETSNA